MYDLFFGKSFSKTIAETIYINFHFISTRNDTSRLKLFQDKVYLRLQNREKKLRQRQRDLAADVKRPRKKAKTMGSAQQLATAKVSPTSNDTPETCVEETQMEETYVEATPVIPRLTRKKKTLGMTNL